MSIRSWLKKFQTIGKFIVFFGIILFVFYQLKDKSFNELIFLVDWWVLIFAALLLLIRNVIGAIRWKVLLEVYSDSKPNFSNLIKYYLIGNFFTLFLPTSVGGDIARIYYLNLETNQLQRSISSVLLERITGVLSIIIFMIVSLIIGISEIVNIYSVLSIIMIIIIIVISAWYVSTTSWEWLFQIPFIPKSLQEKIVNFLVSFQDYFHKPKNISFALIFSMIFQLANIGYYYLISIAIGEDKKFVYFLLLIPIVWIVSLLPISLGGIGIREGSYIALFSLVGMSYQSTSMVSLLNLILLIVQGVFGGVVFLVQGTKLESIKQLNIWNSEHGKK